MQIKNYNQIRAVIYRGVNHIYTKRCVTFLIDKLLNKNKNYIYFLKIKTNSIDISIKLNSLKYDNWKSK